MKFGARQIVLHAVSEMGGHANGKTYLQKLCFFVGKLVGKPLDFRAHFYGPYSDDVSAELAFLVNGDFLTESRRGSGVPGDQGWEIARYDYRITEKGQTAVHWLTERFPDESAQVRAAVRRVLDSGDLDYVGLSFAAKTFWILEQKGQTMTPDGVAEAAKQFRWRVNGQEVTKAAAFLQKLDLARVVSSTAVTDGAQ